MEGSEILKKKIIIFLIIITFILLLWFIIDRKLLAFYELYLIEKDFVNTPQINFQEMKSDFEVVVNVINREKRDERVFSFDDIDKQINVSEEELKSFKSIENSKNDYNFQLVYISIEDNTMCMYNEYGYQIYYIPDDSNNTLKELKEKWKKLDEGWGVVKLDEHWYQITLPLR